MTAEPRRLGFLLLPEFSMMAFVAAIEPFRIANRCAGEPVYEWSLYSVDGKPVAASNGMTLLADASIGEDASEPTVFVCSGFNHEGHTSAAVLQWLKWLAGQGGILGGVDTGAFVLARAGLLQGCRVTLHWESIPAFQELFPGIETTTALYEIDGRRVTCSGGTATMDLALRFIAADHGSALATAVSEQLIYQRIREPSDHQRMSVAARLGVHNPILVNAIEYMSVNVAQPVAVADIAAHCCISQRQLERLFAQRFETSPLGYYLQLRLAHARQLLQETDRSVLEVALACGFGSTASFSRAYRRHFGAPPSRDRNGLAPPDGEAAFSGGGSAS